MSTRRTAALAAIFLALALAFVVFDGSSSTAPDDPRAGGERILDCGDGGLSRIEVRTGAGVVAVERHGNEWRFPGAAASPTRAAEAAADLAKALCELPVIDRIPSAADLTEYGLDTPRAEIHAAGETLLLGAPTPAGNLLYAKRQSSTDVLKIGVLVDSEVRKVAALAGASG